MVDDNVILERLSEIDGICGLAFVDTKELVFNPEFRKLCEEDSCGNYDVNYSCPPYCGEPEKMKEKVLQYKRLLVMQTEWDVMDISDGAELKMIKRQHNEISFQTLDALKALGISSDAMMAGPCQKCRKVCMQMVDRPCPMNYEVYSCISAYCMDVADMTEKAGLEYFGTTNHVYFFSTFMFDRG